VRSTPHAPCGHIAAKFLVALVVFVKNTRVIEFLGTPRQMAKKRRSLPAIEIPATHRVVFAICSPALISSSMEIDTTCARFRWANGLVIGRFLPRVNLFGEIVAQG